VGLRRPWPLGRPAKFKFTATAGCRNNDRRSVNGGSSDSCGAASTCPDAGRIFPKRAECAVSRRWCWPRCSESRTCRTRTMGPCGRERAVRVAARCVVPRAERRAGRSRPRGSSPTGDRWAVVCRGHRRHPTEQVVRGRPGVGHPIRRLPQMRRTRDAGSHGGANAVCPLPGLVWGGTEPGGAQSRLPPGRPVGGRRRSGCVATLTKDAQRLGYRSGP